MEWIRIAADYLRYHLRTILLWIGVAGCFAIVFSLYDLPLEAVLYAAVLGLALVIFAGGVDFFSYYRRHCALKELKGYIALNSGRMPTPRNRIEADYAELVETVLRERAEQISKADAFRTDVTDYYTTWVHQIKTPLAAMRLLLQGGLPKDAESPELAFESFSAELSEELLKTEQYVDMVLQYLRLGSESSDFVFREYDLDEIIRQAVRKFSGVFIRKKLSLDYRETDVKIITDAKWFVFVIDQLLSNSLKYTPSGVISIYVEDSCLVIGDTGIGIEPEDLHRVFEKGFTGYNGRIQKKSTGIGLYLSKRILDKLSHSIVIESKPGKGTKVKIGLERYELLGE